MWTRSGLLALFISFALACSAYAQPFVRQVYGIPFHSGPLQIEHPFTGGLLNPMHQFVDIDGDGDSDLFLFDFNDLSLLFFRNTGTQQNPILRFERPSFGIPPIKSWFRFSDIDGDGRLDFLVTGDSVNSVAIYKNVGTPQVPLFNRVTAALRDSSGTIVRADAYSIPAVADMDGDGDPDYFSLNSSNGTINYYQNIGSPTNFALSFRTDRYQGIQICVGCRGASAHGESDNPSLHGNGTMHFGDIDSDNDFDMLYGDLFDPGLFFFRNVGTPTNPILDSVSSRFPPANPVITAGFNQPTLVDIDGDGDVDLFVSVLPPLQRLDNFRFYQNVGTPTAFDFQLVTKNYINTLDLGLQSSPGFVDIDNDGDQDIYVGNIDAEVAFIRNTGSTTAPAFALVDSVFMRGTNVFAYAPRFVDIDGDNDFDMFLGHFVGKIEFYRNIGSPSLPQFQRQLWLFDTVSVGNFAVPAFFDIDGDGDQDLFIGNANGTIRFYRNTGTPQNAIFTLVSTSFQNISVGSNAVPQFADVDGDMDRDLLVGSSDGKLFLFRNDGPPGNPLFTFATNSFAGIDSCREAAPAVVDIDGDGDMDVFVGTSRGGLEFYENRLITSVQLQEDVLPNEVVLFQNYPNPFNPKTSFRFQVSSFRFVTLRVYDVLGREVATLVNEMKEPGTYEVEWDARSGDGTRNYASGVYLYRIIAGSFSSTKTALMLK